jgi:acetyltransferase
MHVVQYRRSQAALMETPPSVPDLFTMDEAAARGIIAQTLAAGRAWLTEPEAKAVLSAYAIPTIATRVAATPEEAATAAAEMGCSAALKILSPDIIHKTDVGGVELNLVSAEAVRAAAFAMADRVKRLRPDARLEGFTVQQMISRSDAVELIIGATEDAVFGPVILFGHGGTAVEVVRDRALGLPPLNLPLAYEMMSRTRVFSLLQPYRGKPAADLGAIAATLMKVAQLVIDLREVAEVEINPLLANERGVVALDARIRVAAARVADGSDRLVIRPYPKQLERTLTLAGGTPHRLRAIRPEDEPKLQDLIIRSSPEDLRLRFFAPMRQLSHELAARLTQIDYDREMALVALSGEDIVGVVRLAADPDKQKAEYAVFIRSDLKGRGLGWALMQEIMRYARAQGIGVLHGKVLRENTTMLRMCSELGFRRSEDPEDSGVVDVILDVSVDQ